MKRAGDLWRFPGTRPVALLVLLFLYMPIATLVVMSFNEGDSLTIWSGFGLRWYEVVLGNDDMLRAIRNSLMIATVATLAGTTIATMAAIALARGSFRGQRAVQALLGLPLVVPEIVAAIALLLLFVLVGFRLGIVSVMVAHTTFTIPLAFLPIRARLADMDPSLAEAAADLYANEWQTFRRIILPLIWPGIAAGAMLAFIASLGDFVLAFFVSGPGATTLPIYIFGMIRMGITPTVNAISTLLILASVVLLSLSYLLGRRFR
jgi:spermidine/putrescine transport system permease protein